MAHLRPCCSQCGCDVSPKPVLCHQLQRLSCSYPSHSGCPIPVRHLQYVSRGQETGMSPPRLALLLASHSLRHAQQNSVVQQGVWLSFAGGCHLLCETSCLVSTQSALGSFIGGVLSWMEPGSLESVLLIESCVHHSTVCPVPLNLCPWVSWKARCS